MNVIIVDDNPISKQLLKVYLEQTGFINVRTVCKCISFAIRTLQKEKDIDLILLAVKLNKNEKANFTEALNGTGKVIVVHCKQGGTIEDYESNFASDIITHMNYGRFIGAVKKAQGLGFNPPSFKSDKFLFIRSKGRLQKMLINEIEYIECAGDKINIVTADKTFTIYSSLKYLEQKFHALRFVRVHRSYMVNTDKIKAIYKSALNLEGSEISIPIGHGYREYLLQHLNYTCEKSEI